MFLKKGKSIPKVFLFFLLIAFLSWFVNKLSKEYTLTQTYTVTYVNLPQEKLFAKEPLKEVDLVIKGSGFKFFRNAFKEKTVTIQLVDISKNLNGEYLLNLVNQQTDIQNQLLSGLVLQQVKPAVINLRLTQLASKKVPVLPNITINYQLGYNLSKPLQIEPDSILVSGATEDIDKLQSLTLKEKQLDNIADDFQIAAEVLTDNLPKSIKFTTKKVQLTGSVDKFTEGQFEVPFLITNLPEGVTINTFPKKVKVIYKVGLKHFEAIKNTNFSVVCDYNKAKENNVNYLTPTIITKPDLVTSVRLEPQKIEYLINK